MSLRKIRLALPRFLQICIKLTNYKKIQNQCQEGYIEAFYQFHGLGKYFVDFENPGRTGFSKGENIKLIIERNNLKEAIYVGDTEGDLKGARFAGIPFVFAKYGFGKVSDYDYSIDKIDDLVELFG